MTFEIEEGQYRFAEPTAQDLHDLKTLPVSSPRYREIAWAISFPDLISPSGKVIQGPRRNG